MCFAYSEQEKYALTYEDSDTSDEENAGNLNHLGRKLLTTLCDLTPYDIESDDDGDEFFLMRLHQAQALLLAYFSVLF